MSKLRHFAERAHSVNIPLRSFKVVSYNILANKYAVGGYHNYAPDKYLEWDYRSQRVREELTKYNADIVCLQEVESSVYDDEFKPWFQDQGFGGLFCARHNQDVPGPDEGICLFFRNEMFTLLSSSIKRYSEMLTTEDGSIPAVKTLAGRDEGLILALLQHRPSGLTVLAGCTHLFWNPQWPDAKAIQSHLMCAAVRGVLEGVSGQENVPVVIGGDFNSLWRKYTTDRFDVVPPGVSHITSGVYELLSNGSLPPTHQDHPCTRPHTHPTLGLIELVSPLPKDSPSGNPGLIVETPTPACSLELHSSGLKLESAYLAASGSEPPLTTRTGHFSGCLDYVWFTPASLQVTSTLEMPYPPAQGPDPSTVVMDPIPDEHFPSDHLAVGCTLQLL